MLPPAHPSRALFDRRDSVHLGGVLAALAILSVLQLLIASSASAAKTAYRVTSVSERIRQTVEQVDEYYADDPNYAYTANRVTSSTSVFHYFPSDMRAGFGHFEASASQNCATQQYDCNGLSVNRNEPAFDGTLDATYAGPAPGEAMHCERHTPMKPKFFPGGGADVYRAIEFNTTGSGVTIRYLVPIQTYLLVSPYSECTGRGDPYNSEQPDYPVPGPDDVSKNAFGFTQSISASTLQRKNFVLAFSGSREYTVPQQAWSGSRSYRFTVAFSISVGVCRTSDGTGGCTYGPAAPGVDLPTPKPRPHAPTCTRRCAHTEPLTDDEKADMIAAATGYWNDAAQCLSGAYNSPSAVRRGLLPLAGALGNFGYAVHKIGNCDDQVEQMTSSAIQISDPPAPAHRRVQLLVARRAPVASPRACATVPAAQRRLCAAALAAALKDRAARQKVASISLARATTVNRLATARSKGDERGTTIQSATLRAYAGLSAAAMAKQNRTGPRLAALLTKAGLNVTTDQATLVAAYDRIQSGSVISASLLRRLTAAGVVRGRQDASTALTATRAKLPTPTAVDLLAMLRTKQPTAAAAATNASMRSGDLAVLVRALMTQSAITAAHARPLLRVLDARTCRAVKVRAAVRALRVRNPAAKVLVRAGAARLRAHC